MDSNLMPGVKVVSGEQGNTNAAGVLASLDQARRGQLEVVQPTDLPESGHVKSVSPTPDPGAAQDPVQGQPRVFPEQLTEPTRVIASTERSTPEEPVIANETVDPNVVLPPRCKVDFNLGPLGAMTAFYHRVILHGDWVVLVYDRRFVHGTQFRPAAGPAPVQVLINGQESLMVLSLGIEFPMDDENLSIIVLVKVDGILGQCLLMPAPESSAMMPSGLPPQGSIGMMGV